MRERQEEKEIVDVCGGGRFEPTIMREREDKVISHGATP